MKIWIKKIIGFGLASFFSDVSHEMTVSLIPVLVTQFVGEAQAPFYLGIIASVADFFASFLRIISGIMSDRISHKKPLIALGYAISAIFSSLVGFTHSVWTLLMCRLLSFTGSGLREPPRDALIAATIPPANYGRAFGLRNAMDTLGSFVGPLIGVVLAGMVIPRTIFIISCIPGLMAVAAIILFTEDIPVGPSRARTARSVVADLSQLPPQFIFFLIVLFIFDLGFFNKLLLLARTQELINGHGYNVAQMLVLFYAFFNITRACAEFSLGFISDYINRIVLIALFGCGIFAVVSLLLMTSQASILHCFGIFGLAGIAVAASSTLRESCAADMLPPDIRGLGFGVLEGTEGIAALIGNVLIGFLWTTYSYTYGFMYACFMSVLAMMLLLVVAVWRR